MSSTPVVRWARVLVMVALMATASATAVSAQDGVAQATECVVEVEPNDSAELAPSFAGEVCVQGTLVEDGDQDLFVWDVTAEDEVSTWSLSLRRVPATATTVRILEFDEEPEGVDGGLGAEVVRATSDGLATSVPSDTEAQIEAGRYIVSVSAAPSDGATLAEDRDYELRLLRSTTPAPGAEAVAVDEDLGRITVVAATDVAVPVGENVAVELVLDTSGSMRKPLDGTTRIAVAKETLIDLVDGTLPEGLPVALRVFRQKGEPCRSVLRVPLEPLDRKAMRKVIRHLPARKGTKTPIAKALAHVPRDLAAAEGHRVIVLVTDGHEDCGGDPAAVITKLAQGGYTTTVNIIGYSLGDGRKALKTKMREWADLGGGTFFDAPDRATFEAAIAASMQAPYLVHDETDAVVATGMVGDAGVEVAEGTYRVQVPSDPPITFDAVVVEAAGDVELSAGDAPA